MNKLKRYAINILVLLMLIATLISGTKTLLNTNWKIASTAVHLIVLHDNAQFYNEQYRKTDAMTEAYEANDAERQKFYHSEDPVVRFFSNQHTLVKVLILLATVITTLFTPIMWLFFLVMIKRQIFRKRRKAKKIGNTSSKKVVPMPKPKESAEKIAML